MNQLLHSLYARIASVYLLLLLGLAALVMWATLVESRRVGLEIEQRLHSQLARNLATIMEPAVRSDPTNPAARQLATQIATINPTVELYVLDASGRVLATYGDAACASNDRVPLAPINAFLSHQAVLPLTAPSPCGDGKNIFSVASLKLGGDTAGYLYVVLHGRPYHSTIAVLKESRNVRSIAGLGATILVLAGLGGLIGFAFLTRRFRALTASVESFTAGDYGVRVPVTGSDEVAALARAFNGMAATIEAQLAALRETDESRRTQVANISHDFRTPLTSLRAYAERLIAQGGLLSNASRMRYLHALLNNTIQLEHLTDQLSTMSRLDAPNSPLRTEPFSAAELAQDVLVKFQPQALASGVELSLEPPPPLPTVIADIGLIERVLSNLIDNALRNTPPGGSVRLSLASHAERVHVRVTDTGRGIAPEELSLVTQRFYRVCNERQRARQGSGLGLAIAREAIALHGGELNLNSQLDKGTIVTFDLPVRHTSASAP